MTLNLNIAQEGPVGGPNQGCTNQTNATNPNGH